MKQINKNIFWNAVGNTAYNGLQWLITVIVTRSSGFDAAGILAIAMSISLTFRSISYFGIRNFQVTDNNNKYSDSDYWGFRIITSIAAFTLCALVSAFSIHKVNLFVAIILYMIFRVSEGFSDLFQGIMQKNERLDIAGICLFVKSIATTIAFVAGFYLANSLNIGLLSMSLSAILISFLFEYPKAKNCIENPLNISFSLCKQLALETAPMFGYMLETALVLNAPKYFLSVTSDEATVGVYSSVFSLALILQGAFQYVYIPFITKFSTLDNNRDFAEIKKLAIKIMCIFMAITLLFSVMSFIFGDDIMTIIFGKSEQYREIILPSVLSVCFYSITTFISTFAIIKRKFSVLVTSYALGIVAFIIFAFLMKSQGINGVSYSMITASVFIGFFILKSLIVAPKPDKFIDQ
ncbi:MAG: oligosaccharide flippase family protein [Eubacterium sp.]|nr:oligosaccharide flippase family protein [Eubacterium sp.]